jgi:hypothetical protein
VPKDKHIGDMSEQPAEQAETRSQIWRQRENWPTTRALRFTSSFSRTKGENNEIDSVLQVQFPGIVMVNPDWSASHTHK